MIIIITIATMTDRHDRFSSLAILSRASRRTIRKTIAWGKKHVFVSTTVHAISLKNSIGSIGQRPRVSLNG